MQSNSSQTGGFKVMNLRFWGSWFILIALFSVALTMGCEKGNLGVKPATIIGKLVDADDPRIPIEGGLIRMLGKEAVGTSELQQANTFASVLSDANGDFIFENVVPDNVIFQMSAPGYIPTSYPETVKSETTEGTDDGDSSTSTSGTEEIESVSIRSGAMVNLHQIKMKKSSVVARGKANVKLDFVDSTTKQSVRNNLYFMVSFKGVTYEMDADDWRTIGADIDASDGVDLIVMNTDKVYSTYKSATAGEQFSFLGDAYHRIDLTPISFEFCVRTVNVPDHISGATAEERPNLNIFAEIAGTVPAQIIASSSIDVPHEYSATYFTVPLSNAANGLRIRAQVRGYNDIIANIPADKFEAGAGGVYRLDIDFIKNGNIDPNSSDWVQGAYQNIKWREVQFMVSPVVAGQAIEVITSLPSRSERIETNYAQQYINVYKELASGYKTHYTVYRDGAGVASSTPEGILINPESSESATTLVVGVTLQ